MPKCDRCKKNFEGFGGLCSVCRHQQLSAPIEHELVIPTSELPKIADDCVDWMHNQKKHAGLEIKAASAIKPHLEKSFFVSGMKVRPLYRGTRVASFPMKRFMSHQLIQYAKFTFKPSRNVLTIESSTKPLPQSYPVFYLHWEEGAGHHVRLHGDWGTHPDFFMTAPMNGCAVIICGDPKQPHVIHANLDCMELNQAIVTKGKQWEKEAQTKKQQLSIYSHFYQALARNLHEIEVIDGPGLTLFAPDDYLIDGGKAYVFGFKYMADGDWGWRFYYHVPLAIPDMSTGKLQVNMHGSVKMKEYPFTGELWPNRQFYEQDPGAMKFLGRG